jgi:hypothetical protein
MIIPASKAKESFETRQKIKDEKMKALAKDYFIKNQKAIEEIFNKAVRESHLYPHVYFGWPDSLMNAGYEFRSYLADEIAEHVEKFGYKRCQFGLYNGISFEF